MSSESAVSPAKPKLQLMVTPISKPKNPDTVASAVKSKLPRSSSRLIPDDHDYSLNADNFSQEEELSK